MLPCSQLALSLSSPANSVEELFPRVPAKSSLQWFRYAANETWTFSSCPLARRASEQRRARDRGSRDSVLLLPLFAPLLPSSIVDSRLGREPMGLALSLSWPCPLSVLLLFRRFLVLTASSTDRNTNLARKRREKKGEERIAWSSDERRRRPSRSPSPPPFLSGSPLPRLIRLVSFAPLRHRGFHTVESTLTQREVKEAARDNPRIEPRAGNGQPPHDRPKSVLASLTSTPSFFLSTSSQKKTKIISRAATSSTSTPSSAATSPRRPTRSRRSSA